MIDETRLAAETIRMIYPEPWTITPGKVRDGRERRSFLLVPDASGMEMMVPAEPHPVLVAATRRHGSGVGDTSQAKRLAFRSLSVSGLAGIGWPHRLHIASEPGADSLELWLQRRLGLGQCRLAVWLGPPRPNRKPVVQVLDTGGAVRAYVKIGHDALSTSLVSTEAGVLAYLERAGLRGVRVPRVLAHDEWNGLRLLALEPLPVSGPATDRDEVREAAEQIAASSDRVSAHWRESTFRRRLIRGIESGGARLEPLNYVVARLDSVDPVIEFGAWHGDFNPGNFAAGPGGLLVWDWERYDHEVPVGFDVLHMALQRDLASGRDPREAAAALLAGADEVLARPAGPELAQVGAAYVPAHAARGAAVEVTHGQATKTRGVEVRAVSSEIARIYLAWLACRYVRDDEDHSGAGLGSVEQWILPALAASR